MKYQEITRFNEEFYLNPIRETYQYEDVDEGYMADKRMIYSPLVGQFSEAVLKFVADNPDLNLYDYDNIIQSYEENPNHHRTAFDAIDKDYVEKLDARGVLAWIVSTVRAETFRQGILYDAIRRGYVKVWLTRLVQLDQ